MPMCVLVLKSLHEFQHRMCHACYYQLGCSDKARINSGNSGLWNSKQDTVWSCASDYYINLALMSPYLNALSSLGLPSARQTWIYWREFSKGHQGAGAPHAEGEAEEAVFVQPGEEWDQGVILLSRAIWRGAGEIEILTEEGGGRKEK